MKRVLIQDKRYMKSMFYFRQPFPLACRSGSHSFSPFPYLTWAHHNQTLFFFFTIQSPIMFTVQVICASIRSEIYCCHDFFLSGLDSSALLSNCNHYNINFFICHYTGDIIFKSGFRFFGFWTIPKIQHTKTHFQLFFAFSFSFISFNISDKYLNLSEYLWYFSHHSPIGILNSCKFYPLDISHLAGISVSQFHWWSIQLHSR